MQVITNWRDFHSTVRGNPQGLTLVHVHQAFETKRDSCFAATVQNTLKQFRHEWMTEKTENCLVAYELTVDEDQITTEDVLELDVKDLPCYLVFRKGLCVEQFLANDILLISQKLRRQLVLAEVEGFPPSIIPVDYESLIERIGRLTIDESDCIANCANAASAIWHAFQQSRGPTATNWAGFYFVRPVKEAQGNGGGDKILVLGPFMGKPACKRIEFGSGVCGYVAKQLKTEIVSDVHTFQGHIACDAASESEIVVPIFNQKRQLVALIDIDSPRLGGFSEADARGLEMVAELLGSRCHWAILESPV